MMTDEELEIYFKRGRSAFNKNMYEEARKEFVVLYDNGIEEFAKEIAETYYLEKNYEEALQWFHKVQKGHQKNSAILQLAEMYYFGKGTPVDKEKSYQLIYNLPEKSTPFRALNLSIAYTAGEVVDRDFEIAYRYSKQAYQQGLLDGLERMAFLRKLQKRYFSWIFLRTNFLAKGIMEIIRIYILDTKNKYTLEIIFQNRNNLEGNGVS